VVHVKTAILFYRSSFSGLTSMANRRAGLSSRNWAITLIRMTKKSHLYRHRRRIQYWTFRLLAL